ncbi:MAG: hydrogenase expression/formation protein HypE [Chloroflexi bacterium]|nr:hydrogenase expression/formation protein HypE [Chloroflexota bacterium]MBU1661728.1 hydrogenase expression/formation protein HypE [Chloroflexota bacterium]
MTNNLPSINGPVCPVSLAHHATIMLGHGSGGKMMNDLIRKTFLPPLDNPALRAGDDAGVVQPNSVTLLAISTDAHVVSPLFFPGGDIGKLAVCGTVNDVAMMGATPLYLTAGFILEEGLALGVLERVVDSMQAAAEESGVDIVAGDTKVVQRGHADGLYITTAGVGTIAPGVEIGGARAKPGDVVILSGPIGDHGIAVLGARGELGFESDIRSDVAPLNHLIAAMLDASDKIHVLRDPTRGGVASTLNEIAHQSKVCITLYESAIPVRPAVQAACEMLGFDPLYIANEGKLVAIVGKEDADKVLLAMRSTRYGEDTVIIGAVSAKPQGRVLMKTAIGGTRVVDVLMGEMLPRIC